MTLKRLDQNCQRASPANLFARQIFAIVFAASLGLNASASTSAAHARSFDDKIKKSACIGALSLEKDSEKILASARETENEFKANSLKKPSNGEGWFQFLPGNRKILILAPHATSQIREGEVKRADSGTGSLAVILNGLAGTPALYTVYQSPVDPNFYDSSEFKARVTQIVNQLKPDLVIDLHTSDRERPYDVDFGTRHGKSLKNHGEYLSHLKAQLAVAGMTRFSENFFSAEKNQTDTKWVSDLGTPCIQLEINRSWLLPAGQKAQQQRFLKLTRALVKFSLDFKN